MNTLPITFRDVSFIYKGEEEQTKALNNINLCVEPGKFILICGPTGSGKSTLIKSMNGLIPHFYTGRFFGYVRIFGYDTIEMGSPGKISLFLGSLFQNPENQLFTMNVEQELVFGLENFGVAPDEIKERINEIMDALEIGHLRDKVPYELSGGEQQRVALASVLVLKPQILVLDEPLSNLDPKSAQEIAGLLVKLQKEMNITILVSEHRIEYVLPYADEVILIHNGKIVFHNDINEILLNPKLYRFGIDFPSILYWMNEIKERGGEFPLFTNNEGESTVSGKLNSEKSLKGVFQNIISRYENIIRASTPLEDTKQQRGISVQKEPILSAKRVYFTYRKDSDKVLRSGRKKNKGLGKINYVLKDVSFTVYRGEIIGLIGKNGAGKSTLVKLILGIIRPLKNIIEGQKIIELGDRSGIFLDGSNTENMNVGEIAEKVGLMLQNPDHQLFLKSVREELEFSLKSLNLTEDEKEQRIENTLKMLNIRHLIDRSPFHVSGGQKKKIALATILCREPELLIFDEPTIGQDRNEKWALIRAIKALKEKGKTIIIISHDMDFIANTVERIIVLNEGKIFTDGMPYEIFSDANVMDITGLRPPMEFDWIRALSKKFPGRIPENICTIDQLKEYLKQFSERNSE